MKEIWKDIINYEGVYQISNTGRIKSVERFCKHPIINFFKVKESILKQKINKYGYSTIVLANNKVKGYFTVHRLVALMFIPNHENKPQVNHKNGIKSDNRVENLEWVTAKENSVHSVMSGLRNPPKGEKHHQYNKPTSDNWLSKLVLNTQTGIFYDSLKDASIAHGIKYSTLANQLNGNKQNKTNLIYA